MKLHVRRLSVPALLALVFVLAFTGLALAGSSTSLLGYQLDFLGFVNNGDGTSTWTYAVTATSAAERALSHWVLEIESCYRIIAPEEYSNYWTPTDAAFGCGSTYNCLKSKCKIEWGKDPVTGIPYGIKYEDCMQELDPDYAPVTHIYQFTVQGVPVNGGDVQIGIKAGPEKNVTSVITGPACSPNAVALGSLTAASAPAAWPLAALCVTLGLAGIGAAFRRPRM